MKQYQEEQLMGHLGVVLYEYLGEEYPKVLYGSMVMDFNKYPSQMREIYK